MTYDEAVKVLVGAIGTIQKDAPPDILYAAVNQVHKQVEALFVWNLNRRFVNEQAALDNAETVADVDIVQ